jgi:hypothetical protein
MTKKFSETQPEIEKDRHQLKKGDTFTLTAFTFQESKKYDCEISKMNGIDMKTGQVVKYYTTAQAINSQLKNMEVSIGAPSGILKENVGVLVTTAISETNKKDYLTFTDPV